MADLSWSIWARPGTEACSRWYDPVQTSVCCYHTGTAALHLASTISYTETKALYWGLITIMPTLPYGASTSSAVITKWNLSLWVNLPMHAPNPMSCLREIFVAFLIKSSLYIYKEIHEPPISDKVFTEHNILYCRAILSSNCRPVCLLTTSHYHQYCKRKVQHQKLDCLSTHYFINLPKTVLDSSSVRGLILFTRGKTTPVHRTICAYAWYNTCIHA